MPFLQFYQENVRSQQPAELRNFMDRITVTSAKRKSRQQVAPVRPIGCRSTLGIRAVFEVDYLKRLYFTSSFTTNLPVVRLVQM